MGEGREGGRGRGREREKTELKWAAYLNKQRSAQSERINKYDFKSGGGDGWVKRWVKG